MRADSLPQEGPNKRLPPLHLLAVVAVVATWGTNFVVIKDALSELPPLVFVALRYLGAFAPILLFVPRPAVPVRMLLVYGLLAGPGTSGLLCLAMTGHIAPGIASALIQTQAFFTIGLAWLIDGERIGRREAAAIAACAAAVALIMFKTGGDSDLLGVLLILGSALTWGCANLIAKRVAGTEMLGVVVWSSVPAFITLALLALAFDGVDVVRGSLAKASLSTWVAVAWQSVGNTLFGYGLWNWLLARHSAVLVAPFGMLVPVFGMSASFLVLGETMPAWKLEAATLILLGLAINSAPRRRLIE